MEKCKYLLFCGTLAPQSPPYHILICRFRIQIQCSINGQIHIQDQTGRKKQPRKDPSQKIQRSP